MADSLTCKERITVHKLGYLQSGDVNRYVKNEASRQEIKDYLAQFHSDYFKAFPPAPEYRYLRLFEAYYGFLTDPEIGNAVYINTLVPANVGDPEKELIYGFEKAVHAYNKIRFSEDFIKGVFRQMIKDYLETVSEDSFEFRRARALLDDPFVTRVSEGNQHQFLMTAYHLLNNGETMLPEEVDMIYLALPNPDRDLYGKSSENWIAICPPILKVVERLSPHPVKTVYAEEELSYYMQGRDLNALTVLDMDEAVSSALFKALYDCMQP